MGEGFAAAGGVAQGDGIRGGIEADFVGAGVRAGAVGGQTYGASVARGADLFGEFFESAGGSVFFRGVVDFPTPGFVFGMTGDGGGGLRDDLKKKIYANGKVRAIQKRGA